ncbi:hypothetical protein GCM10010172_51070 [Paractinoplanes ferrugineus]|uniref:CAAX prenyl protease 2/Lysostaphin resistance protein A-like domain-containing protein n=1 Tax=Paractinoplanes ferrugineus TaxID=113564 RepID=A0A919J7Q0_9ACTN|nr:CPBP family intramembrane glutamic endopeptidase [Actinoplanes ferrugineus]GIE16075.1 hypothetical protein Afe05nite_79150 [Actinoplanes ferrugineus]
MAPTLVTVPRLGLTGWVVVLLAIGYSAMLALVGHRAYAVLRSVRPIDPDALVAFYRADVVRKLGLLLPPALLPLVVPQLRPAHLGLTWPHAAGDRLRFFVELAVLIVAGGLWWRRQARRGEPVPRPARLEVLVPATRAEHRWAWAASISAGVGEELMFRGLLVLAGLAAGLPPVAAAPAASVLFGAAHLYQGRSGMLGTAGLGLVLCYFYLPTGSLLFPIVLHVRLDLRALVMVPTPVSRS